MDLQAGTTEPPMKVPSGLFALVNGFLSIALMALAALVTRQPLVFPSLGPTAYLLFSAPHEAGSSPRNTLSGHFIGILTGYLALIVFGLRHAGPALQEGITAERVGAAALSLGLCAGLMVWLGVGHPPAGATTLIVSLGILTTPEQMAMLMLAVFLLLVQGWSINRLAGIDYPLWKRSGRA